MNPTKSAVYSAREKMLLAHLVKENGVVENRRTDSATLTEKNKAWDDIAMSYNAQPEVNVKRHAVQLRKLWCNLKQRKRKETTALHHSMLAMGGGPPEKKPELDPVLEMVEDAAPYMDESIVCIWDSTALLEEENAAKAKSILEQAADNIQKILPVTVDTGNASVLQSSCLPSTSSFQNDPPEKPGVSVCVGSGLKRVAAQAHGSAKSKKVTITTHQLELHSLKMKIAQEELLRVVEARKAEGRLRELEIQRATYESELAYLKLQEYKKQV